MPVAGSAPVLLAIDSCGSRPGAALWSGSGAVPTRRLGESPPRAEGLAACVESLLGSAGREVSAVTCLAVVTGPGSYTGLRTGLAFVRGLALLEDLPVAPVSALERLAFCAGAEGERVIATWHGITDLVVAVAYRILDGLPTELDAAGAVEIAELAGFVARCTAARPGRWLLASEQAQAAAAEPVLATIDSSEVLERRVVDSQTLEAVARVGYAKCARGLAVAADRVLPDYCGTSLPRSNRNRVAAPFVERVTR